MSLGKMYEVALTVEGYQSSGKANVYRNTITIGNVNPTVAPTATSTQKPIAKPTPVVTSTPTPTRSPGKKLSLTKDVNAWSDGYTMAVNITNQSNAAVDGWTLTVKKADFNIKNIWNAKVTESGDSLTITPVSWNRFIGAGDTVQLGFQCIGTPKSDFSYLLE
jgi:cellulase/cellobiase CelA1